MSKRRKGSDFFGWDNFAPKSSRFDFGAVKGANTSRSLDRPMPWDQKFRPEQNLKDFSILFDYNYASMWTRWRRGYELFMYTVCMCIPAASVNQLHMYSNCFCGEVEVSVSSRGEDVW